MSTTHVRVELRRIVVARAASLCEYCLIAEEDTYLGCAIDHIIAEKHGGATEADNLANACVLCNQAKGSDVGSILPGTSQFVRLFNPRIDRWSDHFAFVEDRIEPRSDIGIVTARLLRLNDSERLLERQALRLAGLYPRPAALKRLE